MRWIKQGIYFINTRLYPDDETDTLILAALEERDLYGLELYDETGRSFDRLYPALNRLEKLGVIDSYWELARSQGEARRKYYYLKR